MSMKIKADRVRKYKITNIDMLSREELPDEYLAKSPHCHKTALGNGLVLRFIDHKTKLVNTTRVDTGDKITEQEFRFIANMIETIRKRKKRNMLNGLDRIH